MDRLEQSRNDLKIRLDEIEESGYRLSCSRNKDWVNNIFKDIQNTDFTSIDEISIQIEVFRVGKDVFLKGLFNTTVRTSCVKCLDSFDLPIEAIFHYNLCAADEKELLPEKEINKADLDLSCYQGDSIDVVPLLREQIILNVPSYPLCQEACKGICPQCGLNLNHSLCQCDKKEVTSSRFEILKELSLKQ
ncbi:MAG: DUF177 domain-containing protein [Deltaproteobacteria bacterium]|jgi:uncharacterized protein|nr:DUF177 domain-containing protein [Deltaproteobacteria bacterium]MCK5185862.1 DUF177 domain-containing protein [Deltaproteobacteria bacterium]MCK5422288.1 DUF177 domain-containing protein [Deltaproteobacteria bacterium]MCK5513096.1 DUF177 domain-containing protein [Deltaproteobacteria bacterium]NOQ86452.1 hypothetical protein [Deltaproteobacteria bacterium]